jgi:hypothetical protein
MAPRSLEALLRVNTDQAKKDLDSFVSVARNKLAQAGTMSSQSSLTKIYQDSEKAVDQLVARLNQRNQAEKQNLALIQQLETRLKSISGQTGMEEVVKRTTQALIAANKEQEKYLTTENQIIASQKKQAELAASIKPPKAPSAPAGGGGGGGGGFGSAASQIFGAAGLPGGGIIGATGPLGAFTAGLSAANKVLSDFGSKAEDLSKIVSDTGGPLDQLRGSTVDLKRAQDSLIDDPAIAAVQKFKNELETFGLEAFKGAIDEIVKDVGQITRFVDTLPGIGSGGKNTALSMDIFGKGIDKAKQDAQKDTKLIGETKVEYENLMHDRVAMNQEIAMQEQQFAVETKRKERDLVIENQKFEIEQSRKKFDLEKGLARENQDYALEKSKLTQDQAFQTSQKKFQLDMQFEQRAFQQKQQDERQDLQLKMSDARQDFALQQSFKAQDYAKDAGRRAEDYRDKLTDMARSGAGGLEYLTSSRDFTKANRRASQDFAIEQQRAGLEFGVGQGRETRDFAIKQGREGRDYGQTREKTLKEHGLDVEQHYYELRLQTIELDMKHNRALEDATTNLERLAQDTDLGRRDLANKKSDLTQDTALTRQKMNFDESEKQRSQNLKEFDFGGSLVDKLPTGTLQKLMQSNPDISKFVQGDLGRKGLTIPGINAPNAQSPVSGMAGKAGKGIVDTLPDTWKDFLGASQNLGPAAIPLIPFMGLKNLGKDVFGIQGAGGNTADQLQAYARTPEGRKKLHDMGVPGFADGGVVPQDQLALVHKKELILNEKQQQRLFSGMGGQRPHFAGYDDPGPIAGYGSRPHFAGYDDPGPIAGYGTPQHFAGYDDPGPIAGYGGGGGNNNTPLPPATPIQMPDNQSSPQVNYSPQVNLDLNGTAGMTPELQKALQDIQMFANQKMASYKSQFTADALKAISQMNQAGGGFR